MSPVDFQDDALRKKVKNKHSLELLLAILELLKQGSLKSDEMFSRRPITRRDVYYKYLRVLLKHGLVQKDEGVYQITERGNQFLKIFS